MKIEQVAEFMRAQKWAVVSSVSDAGTAQSAVIGIATSDRLEVVFDTLSSSRKAANLRARPQVSLVIGGLDGGEKTVQCEGIADLPSGEDLERLKRAYYAAFPDGPSRLPWPDLIYVRVRLTWLRYSDFADAPPMIETFTLQP